MGKALCTAEHMGLKFDRASACNLQITIHCKGIVNIELFQKALNIIQKRHFYLNVFVDSTKAEFNQFEASPFIPLTVVDDKGLNQWREEAEADLNKGLSAENEPYARVKILRSGNECKIIMTLCHFVSDGISGLSLLKNILEVYNKLLNDETDFDLKEIPEMALDFELFPEGIDEDFSIFPAEIEQDIIEKNRIPLEQRKVGFFERTLSVEETCSLVSKCRNENTTVYGALCAFAMAAMADEISERYVSIEEVAVDCISAINMRQLLNKPISDEQLGFGALMAKTHQSVFGNQKSLWEVARNIKRDLESFVLKHGLFKQLYFISEAFELPDEVFSQEMEYSGQYIIMSNLGVIEDKNMPRQLGNIEFEKISLSGTTHYVQGTEWGIFITANTFDGRLNLGFNYTKGYWDINRVERYANKVVKIINEMS